MHNSINSILKTNQLCILNEQIVEYMNYILIQLLEKKSVWKAKLTCKERAKIPMHLLGGWEFFFYVLRQTTQK